MKDLEPDAPGQPHELCVVVEAVSNDARLAEEIAALASRNLFYARLPGLKGTAGAAALMSDEVLVGEAGYRWTLNHVMEVADATELFTTSSMTVGKSNLTGQRDERRVDHSFQDHPLEKCGSGPYHV